MALQDPSGSGCMDCGVRKYKVYVTILGRFWAEPDYDGHVRPVIVIKSVKHIKTEPTANTTDPEWKK